MLSAETIPPAVEGVPESVVVGGGDCVTPVEMSTGGPPVVRFDEVGEAWLRPY
jgi:hypothetical protein